MAMTPTAIPKNKQVNL